MSGRPELEVVACALVDERGAVLLNQRPAGRSMAGYWEFPGGKVEPGETPEQALRRELREELGIEVGALQRWMQLSHDYPDKRVHLSLFRAAAPAQAPRALDGQALRWCAPTQMRSLELLPADWPFVSALELPEHYLITPPTVHDPDALLARLDQHLAAGQRLFAFRTRDGSGRTDRALATRCLERVRAAGAWMLLNDTPEAARALGADGVHLSAARLRELEGRPEGLRWVAASCHDAEELARVDACGLDLSVLGPVADTPSHPGARVLGTAGCAALVRDAAHPVYALGGLRPAQAAAFRALGCQGVAGISGFW